MRLFPKRLDRDVIVVVRGVGERTEANCVALLQKQIHRCNVHLIHEVPFSAALRRAFEIGLQQNLKWTLVIDADVLVRRQIINDLYWRAEANPASVFVVQTEMLDKFFGGVRVGGIKLYRTAMLERAIGFVPQINVRPETYVIKTMHKNGCYADISDLVCGIHDFEQHHADIFRKGFAHGIKHATLIEAVLPYWRREASLDDDFVTLLAGYEEGRGYEGDLKLDKDEVDVQFRKYAARIGLTSKNELRDELGIREIEKFMGSFASPPEYERLRQAIDAQGRPTIPTAAFASSSAW